MKKKSSPRLALRRFHSFNAVKRARVSVDFIIFYCVITLTKNSRIEYEKNLHQDHRHIRWQKYVWLRVLFEIFVLDHYLFSLSDLRMDLRRRVKTEYRNRRSIPFSLKTRRKTQKTRFFRTAAGNTGQLLCAPLFLFEPFHHPQPCRRSSSEPALFISLTHNSRLPLRPLCIARDTLINSRGSLETRRSDRGLLVDIPFFVISRRSRVPFTSLSQKLKRIAILLFVSRNPRFIISEFRDKTLRIRAFNVVQK